MSDNRNRYQRQYAFTEEDRLALRTLIASGVEHDERGCWNWTGTRMRYGHALVYYRPAGRQFLLHRLAYEVFNGQIAEHAWILHHCDNGACCNPAHLYQGNPAQNCIDSVIRKRHRPGKFASKLNPEMVRNLRLLHQEGVSLAELGRRFDICTKTVKQAIEREIWKHVE